MTDTFLDILTDLVAVFTDVELPEASAEIVLAKAGQIADELDPQYNADMITKISYVPSLLDISNHFYFIVLSVNKKYSFDCSSII